MVAAAAAAVVAAEVGVEGDDVAAGVDAVVDVGRPDYLPGVPQDGVASIAAADGLTPTENAAAAVVGRREGLSPQVRVEASSSRLLDLRRCLAGTPTPPRPADRRPPRPLRGRVSGVFQVFPHGICGCDA